MTPSAAHGGTWLKLSKSLNAKYPELAITQNSFSASDANSDKATVQRQLKDTYVVQLLYMGMPKYCRYRIMNERQYDMLLSFLEKSPAPKRTPDGDIDINDPKTKFLLKLNIGMGEVLFNYTDVYATKVVNPDKLTGFPINDLDKEPYTMSKKQFEQMRNTKAFGRLQKLGKITVRSRNFEEATDERPFKSWLNEKAQKKWDLDKLRDMGLTDEEIDMLLSGDMESTVNTIA